MIEISSLTVITKDGELSALDSSQMLSELLEAEKALGSSLPSERRDRLERIVILIEHELYNQFEETVPVAELQKIVEDRLTEFNEMELVKQMRRNKER